MQFDPAKNRDPHNSRLRTWPPWPGEPHGDPDMDASSDVKRTAVAGLGSGWSCFLLKPVVRKVCFRLASRPAAAAPPPGSSIVAATPPSPTRCRLHDPDVPHSKTRNDKPTRSSPCAR